MYLQQPSDEQVHEFILNQFVVLWEEYARERGGIPAGNLVEVAYDDLARDPVATIGRIYATLGLDGFEERMRARCVAELERPVVREHKVNRFNEMPPELKARVAARWEGFTKAWGYDW